MRWYVALTDRTRIYEAPELRVIFTASRLRKSNVPLVNDNGRLLPKYITRLGRRWYWTPDRGYQPEGGSRQTSKEMAGVLDDAVQSGFKWVAIEIATQLTLDWLFAKMALATARAWAAERTAASSAAVAAERAAVGLAELQLARATAKVAGAEARLASLKAEELFLRAELASDRALMTKLHPEARKILRLRGAGIKAHLEGLEFSLERARQTFNAASRERMALRARLRAAKE